MTEDLLKACGLNTEDKSFVSYGSALEAMNKTAKFFEKADQDGIDALCYHLDETLVDETILTLQNVKKRWFENQESTFLSRIESWKKFIASAAEEIDWQPNMMVLGKELHRRFGWLLEKVDFYRKRPDHAGIERVDLYPEGVHSCMRGHHEGKDLLGDKALALIYKKDSVYPNSAEELQEIEKLHVKLWSE